MANLGEDVIELGSSDEEAEPAPKKKKPMPNAMVQIPNKLPGVTIKPSKPKVNPVSLAKTHIGKAITVTKVSSGSNKLSNPFARKITQNGNAVGRKLPTVIAPVGVNSALKILPVLKKAQHIPIGKTPITRVVSSSNVIRALPPCKFIPGTSIPGTLPPGITVKRTSELQSVLKRNIKSNPVIIQKKKVNFGARKKAPSETVCVDLDDEDDAVPNAVGPSWYLRPEEQDKKDTKSPESPKKSPDTDKTSKKDACTKEKDTTGKEKKATDLQEQNNKEPETPKYIEITIEDSPAKPQPKSKRTCEVADLAITIDDSPVKVMSEKLGPASGSDEEATTSKEKHSKKKLEYPNAVDQETVEIEIELTPVENADVQNNDKTDSQDDAVEMEVVEIEESPLKPAESLQASTPKKKPLPKSQAMRMNDLNSAPVPKQKLKLNEHRSEHVLKPKLNENKNAPSTPGEFHPVFQRFIDLCFQLENSEDMHKIVENKIKPYYRTVPKDYTESEMFIDLVSNKISVMKADGAKRMYMHIKDVVDELSLQRKIAKSQPPKVVTVNEEQEKLLYGEESEFDSKRQRQIRKLEKTLKKLHRAIQKLEEQEVDFDDEEDSVYVLTERYKERMIRVHAKFCQLTNTKMPSEPRVHIDARPGQPKGPAKRLEKWINKKVPIGTPLPFPDFHDVLRCVREANQEDKLCWNEVDVMEEARDLFTRCGRKLQRRRQENEWRLAAARIQSEVDPAEESVELKKALEDNRRVAYKKESAVFNKFADRQNLLNLEAVEIGDKEAEESPVESDDDEPTEDNTSLQTKEKRKEGLKKLLKKKSKKGINEKESSKTEVKSADKTQVQKAKETDNKESSSRDDKEQNDENNPISDPLSDNQNNKDKDPLATENKSDHEKIHSLSDESNNIGSDIDELHLLQKLHSDAFDSSTLESSDSESPIAISDTLSSGDNKKQASDVISIENSSYSESEKNDEQEYEIASSSLKKIITESVNIQTEIECSDDGVKKTVKKSNNNEEFSESVEDILLASSDDEASNVEKEKDPVSLDEQTNVKQPKDKDTENGTKESSELNDGVTDPSSIDSIEVSVVKNKIPHESSEVTSITSAETTDEDNITNAAEITSISSVEMVENDTKTPLEQNTQNDVLKSVNPAATVDDTDNKSLENNQDEPVTSLKENTEAEKLNKTNSTKDILMSEPVENKSLEEITKHTESVQDTVTNLDEPVINTSEVDSQTDNVNDANLAEDDVMSEVSTSTNNNSEAKTKTRESVEDTITTSDKLGVDTSKEISETEKANNDNSVADVVMSEVDNNSEVSTKPTESVKDTITNSDLPGVETKGNSEVTSTESAVIDYGPDNTAMVTD